MATVVVAFGERMMTEASWEATTMRVRFADGLTVNVPSGDAGVGRLEQVRLNNPYEITLVGSDGEEAVLPWDWVRRRGDAAFTQREQDSAQRGRQVFASRLRAIRERKGLTQTQLAEQSGISRVTLNRWEGGTQSPDYANLQKIAAAFQVDLSELMMGAEVEE